MGEVRGGKELGIIYGTKSANYYGSGWVLSQEADD